MGYRSDVVIAIDKVMYDAEILLGMGRDNGFHDAARLVAGTYYWVFTSTKWNVCYPGVKYIESLMDALDAADETGYSSAYGFLRVGEDANDIEERGDPCSYEIYSEVHIDYPQSILDKPKIGEQNATAAA